MGGIQGSNANLNINHTNFLNWSTMFKSKIYYFIYFIKVVQRKFNYVCLRFANLIRAKLEQVSISSYSFI